jgi:serine/threonine-protein kinase
MVLASGVHRLELVNRRFNYRDLVSIRIEPGGLTSHSVALPYGSVRIETTPGAEIWIEGQRVGAAPLDDVAVPIGTREVVVRSADRRERRESVEVRVGDVALVNAVFEPLANAAEAAAGMPTLQAPSLHIIR